MARAPNWTSEEFEQLLQNPQLSDQALADLLPMRSSGAVAAVRSGIHSYHMGRSKTAASLLSKMMRDRLANGPTVTCPVCGATI